MTSPHWSPCMYTVPPWRSRSRSKVPNQHGDLKAARSLTGILNKVTEANGDRMKEALLELTVRTEYGLYTLVDTVCRRALADPSQCWRCAEVCAVLADMEVSIS